MKIETVADKLIILVKKKKRISFADCSEILKVPVILIEQWAGFLSEEGLVEIQYKFATPYLIEKAMSKTEEDDKIKDISTKRDFFIEKELASIDLNTQNLDVDNIKQTFQKVKDAVQLELDAIREELKEIKEVEGSEKGAEKNVEEMKKYFIQKINAISKKMVDDEKVLGDVSKEVNTDHSELSKAVVDMSANLKNVANWIKYLKTKTEEIDKRVLKIERSLSKKWK